MNSSRWLTIFCLASLAATGPAAFAQQNIPHLAYVLPAGGQRGTTFQVKLGGQFLPNLSEVYISGSGVQATIVDYTRPMNGMQATQLRERMQELQKQSMNEEVQKELTDIRVKLLVFNSERLMNPVLAETVTLQITIAADAAPGKREMRVMTPVGLSNPTFFIVGELPEFTEKESINVSMPARNNQPPAGPARANQPPVAPLAAMQAQIDQPATNMAITLPATVNGRIRPGLVRPQAAGRSGQQYMPGDVDRYRFQARKGQNLVVAVSARDLIPYLADAVPGWFQATLALYDSSGKELAFNDDFHFRPDPVLHYEIPKDDEYTIEIRDSIYRGREDFTYRITIGELPFLTGIFPLGGQAGARTNIDTKGWNLPGEKLVMEGKDKGPGIYPVSVTKAALDSNQVPFALDSLPEILEKEPNNTQGNAQRVTLPVIVNGRVDAPGDWDLFRFEAKAGDQIVAEVYARRLDSPLDSVLKLTDASGKQLAFNDDHEDKGSGLNTHHADSFILATLPANGTYYLYLGDAQQKGGADFGYRLRISAPRPDFDLRVTPSGINVGGGMTVPVSVYAVRKDGFSGDIALTLKGAPRGYILSGGLLPAGQDQVRLTLTAPLLPTREPIVINVEGKATIQGREVSHAAVPAEDMMQAFAYRHLVPMNELKIAVRRGGMIRNAIKINGELPLKIMPGGTARIEVELPPLPPNSQLEKIQFELSDAPEGITLQDTPQAQAGTVLVLQCDAAKAKAGLRGNLIVNITAERVAPNANAAAKKQANRQRVPLGTLPALPFEIIKR